MLSESAHCNLLTGPKRCAPLFIPEVVHYNIVVLYLSNNNFEDILSKIFSFHKLTAHSHVQCYIEWVKGEREQEGGKNMAFISRL